MGHALSLSAGLRTSGRSRNTKTIEDRRPRRVRQLVDLLRPVGEEVGNAQPGRNVDRLRDPMAPNEGEKSLSRFVHEA